MGNNLLISLHPVDVRNNHHFQAICTGKRGFVLQKRPSEYRLPVSNVFFYQTACIISSVSSIGQNGGQEFFGSSEECCSSWSGCCNSSCAGSCGDQQPLQQKLQDTPSQQPLSAAMVVMQVHSQTKDDKIKVCP